MTTKTKKPTIQELALIRLCELGNSCVELSTELLALEDKDKLDDAYIELLNRWRALTSRIVHVTDITNKHEFDADVAIKLMMLEIKNMIEDADGTGKASKVLPQASMGVLKREVDSILTGMENVKIN